MNTTWRTFLEQQGAIFDGDTLRSFASAITDLTSLTASATRTPLTRFGLIEITGEDASDFLQAQFTNDIKQVNDNKAQLSGYCSPKGRLLASFILYKSQHRYFLIIDRDILANTLKRLSMFVLRSNVSLKDVTNDYALLGITETNSSHSDDDYIVEHKSTQSRIHLPATKSRYLIITPMAQAPDVWQALTDYQPINEDYWQLLSIQAGLPYITTQTVELFVPQMINLHVVDGVSFKKGCYPGQEIVARTQYLGKLKRRMYRVSIPMGMPDQANLLPGTDIYQSASDNEQSVGKVVIAQAVTAAQSEALVVLHIDQVKSHPTQLHLGSKTGPQLEILTLPYAFPEAKSA